MKVAIAHHDTHLLQAIEQHLRLQSDYDVIWTAQNSQEVLYKYQQQVPSILLLDIDLTFLTVEILYLAPSSILLLATDVKKQAEIIFEAMGKGVLEAVEIIFSPSLNWQKFDDKLKILYQLKKEASKQAKTSSLPLILAIGASIGGPTTLTTLLTQLPQNLPLAIIIVQHVDAQFASSLTDWLSQKTGRLIRPAQEGDVIKEGDILMASKQQHLILNHHLNLGYTEHPIGAAYKPSIDVFFNSLARWWPVKSMALLLTGMGNDGAESLKKLKEADWYTMIEHPDDCVIHSMPTAALDLEAAVDVLKCDEIPNAIMHFCQKHALRSNE